MPLVPAFSGSCLRGEGESSSHRVMQPLCVNVVGGSPRAAEADKIVSLLVRCHSHRRQLKIGSDSTPRSRAIYAETKALAPSELEQLRQFKECVTSAEWTRLKKRAKAVSMVASQQNCTHNISGTVKHGIAAHLSPVSLAKTPRLKNASACNGSLNAAQAQSQAQLQKLEAELRGAYTHQIYVRLSYAELRFS